MSMGDFTSGDCSRPYSGYPSRIQKSRNPELESRDKRMNCGKKKNENQGPELISNREFGFTAWNQPRWP